MPTNTSSFVLYVLACYLMTVSTQILLQIRLLDFYGIPTRSIQFQRRQFVRFYSCLCRSKTESCRVFVNRRDFVIHQSQTSGSEVNSFQYECSTFPRSRNFQCKRLYKPTSSCRVEEKCWTFYVNPRETRCDFAGSIGIVWKRTVINYQPQNISISDCVHGCNGFKLSSVSDTTITSSQTNRIETSTGISISNVDTSEPDSTPGPSSTEATHSSLKDSMADDDQTNLITGVVVGILLVLIIAVLVVGFIFFKKSRNSPSSHQTNISNKTSNNCAPTSSHTETSGQNRPSNMFQPVSGLITPSKTGVTIPTKEQADSHIDTNHYYEEDTGNINNSLTMPNFDQVEYSNICDKGKGNVLSSTSEDDRVEYFNHAVDYEEDGHSCYEIVPGEEAGSSRYNVNSTRTNQVDVDDVIKKHYTNNDGDTHEGKNNSGTAAPLYKSVKKGKQNPEQIYSTLNETVRTMTNPYDLQFEHSEYENTKQNTSNTTNAQREMYFELEKEEDNYSNGEKQAPESPTPYRENESEDIYEVDPYDQNSDDIYSQIDSNY